GGLTSSQFASDPTEKRGHRNDEIARRLARADDQILDRPPRQPEPIKHEVEWISARIHPFYLRLSMEPADVFDFQQHAGRVPRRVLIKGNFEGKRAMYGKEFALEGYRRPSSRSASITRRPRRNASVAIDLK